MDHQVVIFSISLRLMNKFIFPVILQPNHWTEAEEKLAISFFFQQVDQNLMQMKRDLHWSCTRVVNSPAYRHMKMTQQKMAQRWYQIHVVSMIPLEINVNNTMSSTAARKRRTWTKKNNTAKSLNLVGVSIIQVSLWAHIHFTLLVSFDM